MDIHLTNSMTRRKERLEPIRPGTVSMYVCGPTVYDRAHLGNARAAVVFDQLYRLLAHVYGLEGVTFVRNVTDVDDKINARAAETGRPIEDITAETSGWYAEDIGALGCLPPNVEPRATAHVADMIAMIEDLVAKGHAYAAEGHVLFAVGSDPAYGGLSGRTVEDMQAGARVEVAPYKRDPMDFVLWKPSEPDQPGWDSPWGRGRPGWHIECSAMAHRYLGETFDIHGGGGDLIFPHHENELAQSRCAGHGFARVWLHNEMLQVDGRKMSKSLGNFFTVRDLLDRGWPGDVVRLVILGTHYRKPMDWTEAKAEAASARLRAWYRKTDGVTPKMVPDRVVRALADDLNTHQALTEMASLSAPYLKAAMGLMGLPAAEDVAWWREADGETVSTDAEPATAAGRAVRARLADWQSLREARDFAAADALKARLEGAGLKLSVTKAAATAEVPAGFDPADLEDAT